MEAYVFGSAIVVHDLGLPLAAYPGGKTQLRSLPEWRDTLAVVHRASKIGPNNVAERKDESIRVEVDRIVLRARHAKQAELLPTQSWPREDGTPSFLIQDEDLREDFGYLIGQIAGAHWWHQEDLVHRLPTTLSPPKGYPSSWKSRPLLLACLLRCADAAHIDGARAPRWTRVHRMLDSTARTHWDFQERLAQAERKKDRLYFKSLQPFAPEYAAAWWTCLDAARLVDRELRESDRVLADTGLPRLAARSVALVETPHQFSTVVHCDGWSPIDARVNVSDVTRLVSRLGGQSLYGDTPFVPLRELLSNASDASQARTALEGRDTEPTVIVRAMQEGDVLILEVQDHGIGMSPQVLAGALLDFGRSLWESSEVVDLLPGIGKTSFSPVGRFGIGFFSVFMWTHEVEIISRPFREGEAGTHVLKFSQGLSARPVLRVANTDERLHAGGTLVRLRISDPELIDLLTKESESEEMPPGVLERYDWEGDDRDRISRLVAMLAPAFPVDLIVETEDAGTPTVLGGDWETMEPSELLDRLVEPHIQFGYRGIEPMSRAAECMFELKEGDAVVGRAVLVPMEIADVDVGVVTVGGLKARGLRRVAGVLLGDSPNAARTEARPLASPGGVSKWATVQAVAWSQEDLPVDVQMRLAADILALRGHPVHLKFIESWNGPISYYELQDLAASRKEEPIYLVNSLDVTMAQLGETEIFPTPRNKDAWSFGTIGASTLNRAQLRSGVLEYHHEEGHPDLELLAQRRSANLAEVVTLLRAAVAGGWGLQTEDVDLSKSTEVAIEVDGAPHEVEAMVFRPRKKPGAEKPK